MMKKYLLIISAFFFTKMGFTQNAPIAVDDTVYVDFNDSVCYVTSSSFINNDTDPDGDNIYHDTTLYQGLGFFEDTYLSATMHRVCYQSSLDFHGLDSVCFVIRDDGTPVRYDTSMVYFIVKRKDHEYIDLNNIKARVGLNALFYDDKNALAGFEVPKGSNRHTVFAVNLWVAGKDINGNIRGNIRTYNSGGHQFAGPYRSTGQYEFYEEKWDRLWKLSNHDIIYHQNNWANAGYQPIEAIASWPAHGDTSKGEYYYLAPFEDHNNDGKYNPMDGDYPKIKGQQAVFFIYTDMRDSNTVTGIASMGSEVHVMVYAYNCFSDSAIDHTVFVDYSVMNRSIVTLNEAYVGLWADLDIGGAHDDYIGCDVQRGTFYAYNGDNEDLDDGAGYGYEVHPPAQGVVFLDGVYQDTDGIDNPLTMMKQDALDSNGIPYAGLGLGYGDGIVGNEQLGLSKFVYYNNSIGVQGDPQDSLDYYNYLGGRWRDRTQMVWGGNAHVSDPNATNIPTSYMFPGISDPIGWSTPSIAGQATPANWDERTVANPPSDRKGLGSIGPFTFAPGEVETITLAFVFGRDYQNIGETAGILVMQERIDSIRSYYVNDFTSVCGGTLSVSANKKENNVLLVYPNPFHNQFRVHYEVKSEQAALVVYNAIGEKVIYQSVQQKATLIDLSNQANGVYFIQLVDGTDRIIEKVLKQ